MLMLGTGVLFQATVNCSDGSLSVNLPDTVYIGVDGHDDHHGDCDDCDYDYGYGYFYAAPDFVYY